MNVIIVEAVELLGLQFKSNHLIYIIARQLAISNHPTRTPLPRAGTDMSSPPESHLRRLRWEWGN